MTMVYRFFCAICIAVSATNCGGLNRQAPTAAPGELKFTVEAAPEWTQLFYRQSGWFGADGIFSFSLDGVEQARNDPQREVLLTFSDTFIGEVEGGKPAEGYKMVNNTVAYVKGQSPHPDSIRFFYKQDEKGEPLTFFVPQSGNARKGRYYWLGDGFVNKEKGNALYLFAYHIETTGPNVFDFTEPDVSLLALPAGSRPPFEGQRQLATPLHIKNERLGEGNMGAGVLVNTEWAGAPHPDGYVYVYGCIGQDKNLVVARVKPVDFENFSRWRYWNGEKWEKDENDMAPVTNAVSNELSVTPLDDGRYLLVFQVMGISDKVGLRVGASPAGPFGPIQEIWRTPEIDEGLLPYNAKAHPCLSKPGELLISYNTITFDFWNDIRKDAHIYRPRFIRLKWE